MRTSQPMKFQCRHSTNALCQTELVRRAFEVAHLLLLCVHGTRKHQTASTGKLSGSPHLQLRPRQPWPAQTERNGLHFKLPDRTLWLTFHTARLDCGVVNFMSDFPVNVPQMPISHTRAPLIAWAVRIEKAVSYLCCNRISGL
jgi:hypothetical protein